MSKFINNGYAVMRHAEHKTEASGRIILTEKGVSSTQAKIEELAEKIEGKAVCILHSPALRAIATAVVAEAKLKELGVRVHYFEQADWLNEGEEVIDEANLRVALFAHSDEFVLLITHAGLVQDHIGWQRPEQVPNSAIYAKDFRLGPNVT
jgi:phosphohistidine phosphatase SixA